ncbi:MAG: two-component system response regulator CreB [Chitinivibrionales bacterium]|nr:two-component system response regulator CreB [Chitinivibrionales bacterium]
MSNRVLVIEDEPAIADTITYALTTENFEPEWVSTGKQARSIFRSGGYCAVILDIGLPDMNGFELCKEIRKKSRVPIVFLTARKEEVDRVVGLEIGGDDYMVKPFSPRELTARLRAILRRTQPDVPAVSAEQIDESSPFSLNHATKCISYFGSELTLSFAEFSILSRMLKHPERIFSREELLDGIWGGESIAMDRSIDSHIKSLRRILKGVNPALDPIITRRGMGYGLKKPA